MPDIKVLLDKSEKKLDLSTFFGDGAYITIKRLPRTLRKKLQILQMDSALLKVARKLVDGNDLASIAQVSAEKLGQLFIDLPQEEKDIAQRVADEQEIIYLEHGVDQVKHNLTMDGKPFELSVDFWESFEQVALFVIQSIKDFNGEAQSLGEPIENRLIM
jgi:hypothetical protein